MGNAHEVRKWNRSVTWLTNNNRLVLIVGLGLVVVLGALANFNPTIGVACSIIVLILALVEPRPVLIVYGLTLALPLTDGLARGSVVPFLRVGQALLVVGFLLFLLARSSRQGKSRLTTIDLAFILFILAGSVFPSLALYYRGESLDLTGTDSVYGLSPLQFFLGPVQYYLLYRIVVSTISSKSQIRTVLRLSFVASIIVSVLGILQKLGVGSVRTFLNTYYPPVSLDNTTADVNQRITSTMAHFSSLAAYLSFTIILALVCYTAQKQLKISPLLLAVTILLDSIALILTGTLAAWIGLAVGAAMIFILIRRVPKLVFFILVGVVLAVIIFQPFISGRLDEQLGAGAAQGLVPQSLALRIKLWTEIFFPAIGQHLFFGAGPTPAALNSWSTEDSEYLLLLLRGGLLYFFSYLLLIGVAIVACWRQIKSRSDNASRYVAIAALAILVAISVMNISAEYFTYAGGAQTLWMLVAIVVSSGQCKALGMATTFKRIMDGKARTLSMSFHNSLGIAASTTASGLAAERNMVTSNSLIPISAKLEVNKIRWHRQHFARLKRLLDWHFVKDSVVVGIGSTIARALGLLSWTLLGHFLAPDDFGFVRYSATLAAIVALASTSGPLSIARFLAANPNDNEVRDLYFSNGMVGSVILLTFTLLISVPILWLLHDLNLGMIISIVGLAGFFSYFAVVLGLGNAWKMGLAYLLNNGSLVIALLLVIDLLKLRTALMALVIYGVTYLTPVVIELFKPISLHFRPSLISKAVLLDLARFATPLVMASGFYTIWAGLDVVLVENFTPHAAGAYAAAKTLSGAFIFVPSAITIVLMPRVAAMGADKSKRYNAGAVLVAILISIIGLVIVDVWGHKLISLTFGQRYSDAYSPLLVLGVGMSIYSLYVIFEGFVIGRGRPNLSAHAMIVALIGTCVTGFWLTPRWGPLGASLSFTIGAALGFVALLFNTWHFLRASKQAESNQFSGTNSTTGPTI